MTKKSRIKNKSVGRELLIEEIRRSAYELYEKKGAASYDQLVDWFDAIKVVKKAL